MNNMHVKCYIPISDIELKYDTEFNITYRYITLYIIERLILLLI